MSQKQIVLNGYRRLLRGATRLFGADEEALRLGRIELRQQFELNRNVTDSKALQELIQGIDEAADMMENNLVQGKLNQRGNYEVEITGVKQAEEGKDSKCSDNLFDPTPPEELLKEYDDGPAHLIRNNKHDR
mmetsp:Transcript_1788/g.2107  ORF Transcript_1788/g.2107 Transcript_1788/m.2107 type:complete len:132 (-) Transcript_1788:839-1234(-)|eukprot:CAMPEP_0184036854 /NCGR_PEP_ID=MMETSP0955-20130417/35010_1 /TAXON_ID=627963 /ORGANISM="Aplanochytrium sp, Strain PBS07" /LENGTH=131 /DNA_ID=CAMNT_0026324675 /DNA_START=76 /DNA_END=471 /DNA_ORIENTATION=+